MSTAAYQRGRESARDGRGFGPEYWALEPDEQREYAEHYQRGYHDAIASWFAI